MEPAAAHLLVFLLDGQEVSIIHISHLGGWDQDAWLVFGSIKNLLHSQGCTQTNGRLDITPKNPELRSDTLAKCG